jgi:hypothetical protein
MFRTYIIYPLLPILIYIDPSTLTLQNLDIDGASDFLSRIVLSNMSTSWETYDGLPRYLATRVDPKFGPIRISNTALQSRTIYKLVEEASFARSGKGMIQMCVCFEDVIQEIEPESSAPITPSPLPYRTTKPQENPFVIKKENQTKVKKENQAKPKKRKTPAQGKVRDTRKRGISQVSSPQTTKTPPTATTTTEIESYDLSIFEDSDNLSDLILPGTDDGLNISSSYDLRSRR